jgi:tetratricopeptide (TPR) repeat protein/glycosyltransferase involved in cell wall biosynthesis
VAEWFIGVHSALLEMLFYALTMTIAEIPAAIHAAQQSFQAGDWETVERTCQQVLQQSPDHLEALELLGMLYCQTQQFEQAIAYYNLFLTLNPNNASAHYNIGTAFSKLEQLKQAIAHYQQSIVLDSSFYPCHYNLGNAYQSQGNDEAAIACYQTVLTLKLDHRQAIHNLGACLQNLGQVEEAIAAFQKALALKPDHALTHNSLGDAFRRLGRLDEAVEFLRRAIALDPNFPEAYQNLGTTLYQQGEFQAATDSYQQALRLRPDYPKVRFNYSFILLLQGDLRQGFREYESRWVGGDLPLPKFSQPQWDGSDLTGKTILLHPEQGLGDTIQFVRYAPLVKQRGGRVLFGCPPALFRLLETAPGIDRLVAEGESVPEFDCYAPLLSLPHLLDTTLETIPAPIPYLAAPAPSRIHTPLKVGLVWAGNPKNGNDADRSTTLAAFSPLFALEGIEFYSLQKGKSAELQQFRSENRIAAPLYDLEDQLGDFADTAAAIAQLDLVISVDTAVAHLAGAMGKPVWILLCTVPDWRWLLDRADSPWYPTVRLFRQARSQDWSSVITSVKKELTQLIQKSDFIIPSLSQKSFLVGINFPIGGNLGWGVYGLNLAIQLLKISNVEPIPLMPLPEELNPIVRSRLVPLIGFQQQIQQVLHQHSDRILQAELLILNATGNHFAISEDDRRVNGKPNVGVIFSEDTAFDRQALERGKRYDRLIAGSTWNADVLKSYGLSIETVQQGVDSSLFHPMSKSGLLRHRFVIFSGGKLEYRKGQDIIIAAFRIFQARHPEALLITAWHNYWARTMIGLERAGHIRGLPKVNAKGHLQITPWLVENGIPENAIIDVGLISNDMTPRILREADVALFTNRAEGGTNLVAMESLACGIPTILSMNTGHLDLIRDDRCYPLKTQRPVLGNEQYRGTEGWGESDVEEVVEMLEAVYGDRAEATRRGNAAAQFMQDWTWEIQTRRLLQILGFEI